jgi:hypothetical protein
VLMPVVRVALPPGRCERQLAGRVLGAGDVE